MEFSDETNLDDGSEALPDQSKPRIFFSTKQLAPDAPRWMSAAQRDAFYFRDLCEVFGEEYLSDNLEGQVVLSNFPKRSSKKPEPMRIPRYETTDLLLLVRQFAWAMDL